MIPDASRMLINISNEIPQLIRLATAIMYVLGIYIIVISIAAMRNASIIHSPQQGQQSMWTLWKHVFVGAALIYFPSTVHVAIGSLFGGYTEAVPYAYMDASINPFSEVFNAVFLVIELVGVIAIGKGVYGLGYGRDSQSKNGEHHGYIAKAITQIIAGALCINLHVTLVVIFNTLGITGILN